MPKSEKERNRRITKRIKKNDPVAMTHMGKKLVFKGEYGKALEYYKKAAELDYANGHASLGGLYFSGEGVEKDVKKAVYHMEQAAIGGHPQARCLLAFHEKDNGRFDRAAKHFMIAANLGCNDALNMVKDFFVDGIVSKDEYAAALRGYQTAVNETKSAEREEGESLVMQQPGVAR